MHERLDSSYSFYMALGLQPGASPAEVKSAYRRLAKIYHPDHDQSLDAEVRYKEIRAAYEALRGGRYENYAGVADASADSCGPEYRSTKQSSDRHSSSRQGASWQSSSWQGSPRQTSWASESWTVYDTGEDEPPYYEEQPAERVPLSLSNLPSIFFTSLKELARAGVVLQVLIAMFIISLSYAPSYLPLASSGYARSMLPADKRPPAEAFREKPYKSLVRAVALASGLASVILRYYVTPRRKLLHCAAAVFAYAAAVAVLVKLSYPKETDAFLVWLCFFSASMIMALNPLVEAAEPIDSQLWDMFRQRKSNQHGRNQHGI